MPVRNRSKGESVAKRLRTETGNENMELIDMDLGDPQSVRECAAAFLALDQPLDILINNAGIMACPLQRTPQGWESQFATNHLARTLHEAPTATADALRLAGVGLQKDLTHDEMAAMGWFDDEGNVGEGFKTPAGGAATATWAATTPLLEGAGGLYLEDCNVAAPADPATPYSGVHAHALNRDTAEKLWQLSEDLLRPLGVFSRSTAERLASRSMLQPATVTRRPNSRSRSRRRRCRRSRL